MRLIIKASASKELIGLPRRDRERVEQRIEAFAAEPGSRAHDVAPIVGSDRQFRLRVGDWRVILMVHDDLITVMRVRHRREAYR